MTKKQQVWSSKTTVFFTLFCTFLCRRCRTTTWNFLISCSMEDWTQDNDVLILFFEPRCSPLEYNFRKITNIWEIEWHGKREMNIETVCPTRCRTLIRVLGILGWTMSQNTLLAPGPKFHSSQDCHGYPRYSALVLVAPLSFQAPFPSSSIVDEFNSTQLFKNL